MVDVDATLIAAFRSAMPAFSDSQQYTDDMITSALYEADAETGGRGWGAYVDDPRNFKRRGMFAYAAHWIAITYPGGGGDETNVAGDPRWAESSKSVGDESTTYAQGNMAALSPGNAALASTRFGQDFIRLRRRAGMGARVV